MPKYATFEPKQDLHKLWSKAKKDGEAVAKKGGKPELKTFQTLTKAMKSDLGPSIDKWVKAFGDRRTMEGHESSVTSAIGDYQTMVTKAMGKGVKVKDAPASLRALAEALDDLQEKFAGDVAAAREQLGSDMDRAVDDSITMQKKDLRPIQIVVSPDIVPALQAELKKRKVTDLEVSGSFDVEITIGDTKLLEALYGRDENAVILVNTQEAAKLDLIVSQTADAVQAIEADLVSGKITEDSAAKQVVAAAEAAIDAGLRRAEKALETELKVRGKVIKTRAKTTASIVIQVTAIAGGIAGIAVTPFTGGASTVIGLALLARSSAALGKQIGEMLVEVEPMLTSIESGIFKLAKEYQIKFDEKEQEKKSLSGNQIALREWGRHSVNAVLGSGYINNLTKLNDDAGTSSDKINEIHKTAQDLGAEVPKILDKQTEFDRQLQQWKSDNAAALGQLDSASKKKTEKLEKELDKVFKNTNELLEKVVATQQRREEAATRLAMIRKGLGLMRGKAAAWLDFAEAGTTFFVEAGFIVGGNVSGALGPSAYQQFATAGKVIENVARVQDSATTLYNTFNDAKDIYGAKIERDKAQALR